MTISALLWDRDILIAAAALLLSLALLLAYLRAVKRSMLRSSRARSEPESSSETLFDAQPSPPSQPLDIGEPAAPSARAVRAAWAGPTRAAAIQIVAGFIYALGVALAWGLIAQRLAPDRELTWQGIMLLTLFFAWPVVIVVGLVATVTWRAMALVLLGYVALLAAFMAYQMQGTTATAAMIASGWWGTNGAATIVVLVLLARPIRAMGPIVMALSVAAALGIFGTAGVLNAAIIEWIGGVAGALGLSGKSGGYVVALVLFGVPALLAAILGYLALRGLGRLYRQQWLSDQTIQTDAVWLTFAILQAPQQLPYLGLVVFPLYKLASWLGYRMLRPSEASDATAPSLLLLRVFSLGARSSRLFDAFSRLWRYKGRVRMIAGPDLANTTVEPHEFLDFLAGRLNRRFISGPDVLERRLAEAETGRDLDGRFRVASFYCHDDTWRMVLRRLARESDLVLMDLRGFTPANQGCVYELGELLDAVQLDRIVLVVDGTTDDAFLTEALRSSWAGIGAASRNRQDPHPCIRLYRFDSAGKQGMGRLVATLAA